MNSSSSHAYSFVRPKPNGTYRRTSHGAQGAAASSTGAASAALLSAAIQQQFTHALMGHPHGRHSNGSVKSGAASHVGSGQQRAIRGLGSITNFTDVQPPSHARPTGANANRSLASSSHASPSRHVQSEMPGADSLSLARKLGLEPATPAKLSAAAWAVVRAKSQKRQHSELVCPICQEQFRLQAQVLLSCSHVYHAACLQNFERFSGTRCCPICRCDQYEKMVIDDGAVAYRTSCAVRIQAAYRGYRARQQYAALRIRFPPRNPQIRRQFFVKRLADTSNKLLAALNTESNDIDALFAEIDNSLALSRGTLQDADMQLGAISEVEWQHIHHTALARQVTDCPVCMMEMDLTGCTAAGTASRAHSSCHVQEPKRKLVLLSCSHMFHDTCLASFEQFSAGRHGCPLCRSSYQKRQL